MGMEQARQKWESVVLGRGEETGTPDISWHEMCAENGSRGMKYKAIPKPKAQNSRFLRLVIWVAKFCIRKGGAGAPPSFGKFV
mgnify:CR=1 FL=1